MWGEHQWCTKGPWCLGANSCICAPRPKWSKQDVGLRQISLCGAPPPAPWHVHEGISNVAHWLRGVGTGHKFHLEQQNKTTTCWAGRWATQQMREAPQPLQPVPPASQAGSQGPCPHPHWYATGEEEKHKTEIKKPVKGKWCDKWHDEGLFKTFKVKNNDNKQWCLRWALHCIPCLHCQ